MGRWGFRKWIRPSSFYDSFMSDILTIGLFEGDSDIDIACVMPDGLCIQTGNWEHTLASMIFQTDMLAPAEARARYRTEEYKNELANEIVPYVRWKLDTKGLGDQLFAAYRAEETKPPGINGNPRYITIIFGALMLRAGAKIKAEDLQHLRDLVPQVNCRPNWILGDDDFRTPGRAQFLAALDRYQPGVPSDFQEPR
jgi:hypothetical protein